MTPDRKDRIDALIRQETKISDGSRGCPETNSDMLVEISRALRSVLSTEYITVSDCVNMRAVCPGLKGKLGPWSALTIITAVLTIAGLIFKFVG